MENGLTNAINQTEHTELILKELGIKEGEIDVAKELAAILGRSLSEFITYQIREDIGSILENPHALGEATIKRLMEKWQRLQQEA